MLLKPFTFQPAKAGNILLQMSGLWQLNLKEMASGNLEFEYFGLCRNLCDPPIILNENSQYPPSLSRFKNSLARTKRNEPRDTPDSLIIHRDFKLIN